MLMGGSGSNRPRRKRSRLMVLIGIVLVAGVVLFVLAGAMLRQPSMH